MPSTPDPTSSSRRIVWLGIAVIAAIVAWTIGWYVVAAQFEARLPATLDAIAGRNAEASCAEASVRGYPFRFGLFCDQLTYASPMGGIAAQTGALRSAAQFYRPGRIVAELDGPLALTSPGISAQFDWQAMQASLRAAANGMERSSLDGRNVTVDIDGIRLTQKLALQADRMTAHVRRNGDDLDIAAYADRLRSNLAEGLTVTTLALEATLAGQADLLNVPGERRVKPGRLTLHRAALQWSETSSLELAGTLEIGLDGRLSGELQLAISNPDGFPEIVEKFDQDVGKLLRQIAPLLAALDTTPGDDAVTLPLILRDGRVSLGMFPLGELPGF